MPILKNAKKALRVSQKKTTINRRTKSKMKTAISRAKKKPNKVNQALAARAIDRAAKKNVLHSNKAARLKAKVAKFK